MKFDLDQYLTQVRHALDQAMRSHLPEVETADPLSLRRAMGKAVLAGGKRLRPCLTVAACEAVGGSAEEAYGAGCAVELVHCYSLVHDDLPAMDDDDMRRGQPTCHKEFGETAAILVGDALLTLAFEVLAAEGIKRPARGSALLRAAHELARAAGARGMVGGQAMDMTLKGTEPSFKLLELCHAGKTAALFSAAAVVGGLAGGGSDQHVEALRGYGFDLGMAFQHADDLRDAEFTHHREQAHARALELAHRAARTAGQFGNGGAPLAALAELVHQRARESMTHELPAQN
ncbi:MAG: polyprenyl synthetase family protein [Deltaproteobacteria bacterium]|nr:polyprenyl synthetase family protein [Deltaproteobacteria bacterium]